MTPTRRLMRPRFTSQMRAAAGVIAISALLAACSPTGAGSSYPPAPTNAAVATAPVATTLPAATGPGTTPAGGALTLQVSQDPDLGAHVAGKDGLSLYVFSNDAPGTSACNGDCSGTWPPLTVRGASDVSAGSGVTGALGTITRSDGTIQVTLNGQPLYYYSGDLAAGDTEGQGIGDVWYLASPSGDKVGDADESPGAGESPRSTCGSRYCY